MTVALPQVRGVRGRAPGPVLVLLAGVHGNELVGVLAVNALLRRLSVDDLCGEIRCAAPAHPAAWDANLRVSPLDGLNLAREFPGDPAGRPTQQVAAHLTAELLTGADLVVDLHTAGVDSDMPLLCGYGSVGPTAAGSAAAAAAFAAPITWLHPVVAPGRSLSAAAAAGVPSIYVETAGGNRVTERDLQFYVDGVLRVMAHLWMVRDAPEAGSTVEVIGDGNTDEGMQSPVDGFFVTSVEAGASVETGDLIGRVVDEDADTLAEMRSDTTGLVTLLQHHARVSRGDTLAIVARRREVEA